MARAGENEHDVDPGAGTVVQVAAGEAHTLALTASGSVYTWGRGQFGRMGMGVFQDELVPTLVEIGVLAEESPSSREDGAQSDWDMAERSRITQIAAGSYHSLALGGDGTVWSWGFNAYGQLGRQRAASYPAPVDFPDSRAASFDESRKYTTSRHQDSRSSDVMKVTMVEAGGMMSSAIDHEGGLWLWGAVPQPSTDNQSPPSSSFELANVEKPERVLALTGHKVRRVSCGSEHILALVDIGRSNGAPQCYAWGGNANGQLGVGDFEPRDTPTKVIALGSAQQLGVIVDFACGFFHSVVVTAKDGESSDQESEGAGSLARRNPHLMDQVMASPKQRGREQYMVSPRVRAKQGYPYSIPNGTNSRSSNRSFSVHSDTSSRAQSQSSVSSWAGNSSVRAQVARREAQLPVAGGGGEHSRISSCWTFGQGENGQLGNGSRANSYTPAVVEALPTHERILAVACGLFHTAVVTEVGDVWVWGMEGGLGQCPGIGPPGSKSGDALTPVRVFGESSARCNLLSGSKGIACGAAHTVTVANGGRDLWAWGRGKNGVLGLGHASDSWFPSPVVWPPGVQSSGSVKDLDVEAMYDARKSSSRASSRAGSRGRGDEIRPYARDVDDSAKPPRSNSFSRLPGEQQQQYLQEPTVREVEVDPRPPRGVPSHRTVMESPGRPRRDPVMMESPGRAGSNARRDPPPVIMQSPGRPSRRGDQFWPPVQQLQQPEPENPRALRRDSGSEPSSTSMRAFKYQIGDALQEEDVTALKLELAECRRYAEGLHVAVYGGLDVFALPLPEKHSSLYYDSEFDSRRAGTKSSALQDWHQHVDEAPLEELAKLEQFYKTMRNRLKDILFQRKMEDWCRRVQSGFSAASYQEPPPVREPYSVQSTPYFNDPGELALRMSGILSDRGEMLPPAALAASIAEFRMHSQRRR